MTGAAPPSARRLVLVVALAGLGLAGCSTDTSVPAPEAEQRRETAAQLARATAEQDICYGWRLDSANGGSPVSRGSNLGDGIAVDSDPQRCPAWVEVRASVSYVPDSSESEDSATVGVQTSPGLSIGPTIEASLSRFGIDEQAFVDDPGWAVAHAALVLPLLTAEAGAAEPAATPTAPATAASRALPDPGNDFWRDRWVFVLVAAGLVLLAGLFVTIGVVAGRRQRVPAQPR
jgi:hypothetical protein